MNGNEMLIWSWLIAAGVLGAAELLTGTFYMLVLGAAALCGAAASAAGAGPSVQILIAAAAAVAGCVLVWRHHRANAKNNDGNSLDEGQKVEVRAFLEDGTARVRYRGAEWPAVPEAGSDPVPGLWVIRRVDGPRLLIFRPKAEK